MNLQQKSFTSGVDALCSRNSIFNEMHKKLQNVPFEIRTFDFSAFVKIVIGQQLSGKAANTIFNRYSQLFPECIITAEIATKKSPLDLKSVGISKGKAIYINNFAEKLISEPNFCINLKTLTPDDAYTELIKLKGVGPWTANIIQLFYLGHLNVFPFGDVSLEKTYSKLFGTNLNYRNKTSYKNLDWASPYKGVLAIYLWDYLDQGFLVE